MRRERAANLPGMEQKALEARVAEGILTLQ